MTSAIRSVHDADFDDVVLGAGRPVLVAFHAPWCAPCRRLLPVIEELAVELDWMSFTQLDVDREVVTAAAYRVTGLPTLLLFDGGELVLSIIGVRSRTTIRQLLSTFNHERAQ